MTGLSRRQFLAAGGGLTVAGPCRRAGRRSPAASPEASPATADVIFWHLFGGGDGANMATMVDTYRKKSGHSVEATLLSWGNPYYTKLALVGLQRPSAGRRGRPPLPAAAARPGRAARAGRRPVRAAGVTEDKFTPAAWKKATVDGTVYAVPLDTHPFVCSTTSTLAKKAGLLDEPGTTSGRWKNADDLVEAIKAMKDAAGGDYGAVDDGHRGPVHLLALLHDGLLRAGRPARHRPGHQGNIDRRRDGGDVRVPAEPHRRPAADARQRDRHDVVQPVQPGQGRVPLRRRVADPDVPRRSTGSKFNVVPFPALLGPKPVAYADSHSLVIPASSGRSDDRGPPTRCGFIKGLLDESATWADGGHVPAWLPVQESQEFKQLEAAEQLHRGGLQRGLRPGGLVHRRRLGLPDRHGLGDRRCLQRRDRPEERGRRDDLQPEDLLHRPPARLEVTR